MATTRRALRMRNRSAVASTRLTPPDFPVTTLASPDWTSWSQSTQGVRVAVAHIHSIANDSTGTLLVSRWVGRTRLATRTVRHP